MRWFDTAAIIDERLNGGTISLTPLSLRYLAHLSFRLLFPVEFCPPRPRTNSRFPTSLKRMAAICSLVRTRQCFSGRRIPATFKHAS